jgi:hypothetical protein
MLYWLSVPSGNMAFNAAYGVRPRLKDDLKNHLIYIFESEIT